MPFTSNHVRHLRCLSYALAMALSSSGLASAETSKVGTAGRWDEARLLIGAYSSASVSAFVTNCNDAGPGSLREAYFNAVDGETIDLSQLSCSRITLTSGAVTDSGLDHDIALKGSYAHPITIDAGANSRVIVHNGNGGIPGTLRIAGLNITNGRQGGDRYGGGCIYSYGGVTLTNSSISTCFLNGSSPQTANGGGIYAKEFVYLFGSSVTDCHAYNSVGSAQGGGIFSKKVIATIDSVFSPSVGSTISGNIATVRSGLQVAAGGGIFGNTVHLDYSTASYNRAEYGGGIYATNELLIKESTLSKNTADRASGGAAIAGTSTVLSSTIAFNTADAASSGAGLTIHGSSYIVSSIIANNTANFGASESDLGGAAGPLVTGRANLIMQASIPVPSGTLKLDPQLQALKRSSAFPATQSLKFGSPAIDAGVNIVDTSIDERGAARTENATDIGAVEFHFEIDELIFKGAFEID